MNFFNTEDLLATALSVIFPPLPNSLPSLMILEKDTGVALLSLSMCVDLEARVKVCGREGE